jgi:hypothetical protein
MTPQADLSTATAMPATPPKAVFAARGRLSGRRHCGEKTT